ncbi:hypothetical protein WJX84_002980 [Apatococcus fuscideae]|uniref:Uncharacterized protein n=1 Tax=Apatococcus fuscideae TaxID=2026836 RepID=A0AAW1T8M5_9CHLO
MRQQLQQHLATLASFKGRTPGSGALPLPPIGGVHDDTDGEPEVNSKRQRLGPESLGCDVAEGGVVVSVMLPTRQGLGAAEPSLTSVEQIYVVVLKPSKQYTTYACSLPKAMYV